MIAEIFVAVDKACFCCDCILLLGVLMFLICRSEIAVEKGERWRLLNM